MQDQGAEDENEKENGAEMTTSAGKTHKKQEIAERTAGACSKKSKQKTRTRDARARPRVLPHTRRHPHRAAGGRRARIAKAVKERRDQRLVEVNVLRAVGGLCASNDKRERSG